MRLGNAYPDTTILVQSYRLFGGGSSCSQSSLHCYTFFFLSGSSAAGWFIIMYCFVPLYNDEVIEATSSHRYEDGRLATNTHATDIATEERSTLTEYNT